METSETSSLTKTGQALADKTARKIQDGIRSAEDTAKDAGGALSRKVDCLRSEAAPAIAKSSGRLQSTAKQGLDALTEMATGARDFVSNASDSIVSYTKKNPMKSLAIAASSALIYAAYKAFRPSRD